MNPSDLEDRPPGWEPSDPYEGVDVAELPSWWTRSIAEFDWHGLRPYRPPRFEDDAITPPVVERLEAEYDAEIRFVGVDADYGDAWGVYVDGERVLTADREREPAEFTRFHVTRDDFERAVRARFDGD